MTSKSIDHKSTNTRIIWKLDILWKLPIWDKDIKWKTDVGNMETIDLLDVCLPQTSVYKKKKKKAVSVKHNKVKCNKMSYTWIPYHFLLACQSSTKKSA